jgi:hypothetical protein
MQRYRGNASSVLPGGRFVRYIERELTPYLLPLLSRL